jgi:hypothetical protein
MQRSHLVYGVFVVAAASAVAVLVWQRRPADAGAGSPESPRIISAPPAAGTPGLPPSGPIPPGSAPPGTLQPGAPPFTGPLQPGVGPLARGGTSTPPFTGGVVEQAVVDLNSAPVSALVTLPGITAEYARKIVANRPYKDRIDLERKTGLPHDVVEKLGPPAMIQSTSFSPPPIPKKKP